MVLWRLLWRRWCRRFLRGRISLLLGSGLRGCEGAQQDWEHVQEGGIRSNNIQQLGQCLKQCWILLNRCEKAGEDGRVVLEGCEQSWNRIDEGLIRQKLWYDAQKIRQLKNDLWLERRRAALCARCALVLAGREERVHRTCKIEALP